MNVVASTGGAGVRIEVDDIQSGALHPRPMPYVGRFVFLRVDDRHAGRSLLRRLLPAVEGGFASVDPSRDAWVAVAFTYQGCGRWGAAGVAGQLSAGVSPGHGRACGPDR